MMTASVSSVIDGTCGMFHKIQKKNEESSSTLQYEVDRQPFTSVKEGRAKVEFPSNLDIFYNPVQEFNRDISVAVLKLFAEEFIKAHGNLCKKISARCFPSSSFSGKIIGDDSKESEVIEKQSPLKSTYSLPVDGSEDVKEVEKPKARTEISPRGVVCQNGIQILEGLAASGLRSIRYALEVGGIKKVVANDISKKAVECIRNNLIQNGVEHIVTPSESEASMFMYLHRDREKRFHAIDLDPYGSPHKFLDAAVQAVTDGGVLLVTCTDMAVLCGMSPETCYTKYGALSIKSRACHEIALRIVLQSIESHANRYGRFIVPLLSMSVDFYVRVVVQVCTSQRKCKETFSKLAWLYQCVGCETITLQPLGEVTANGKGIKFQLSAGPAVTPKCLHCGHKHLMAGPIWAAPIHDIDFISKLKNSLVEGDFQTYHRMYGILTVIEEELPDVPLYYVIDKLASTVGTTACKMVQFRSALINAGYKVSLSHCCKNSIKTNASPEFIWDIMRAWENLNPAKRDRMASSHPGKAILGKHLNSEINFGIHPHAEPPSRKHALLRFQVNPEKNWGPKMRAKTSLFSGDQAEKSKQNQGKRKQGRLIDSTTQGNNEAKRKK